MLGSSICATRYVRFRSIHDTIHAGSLYLMFKACSTPWRVCANYAKYRTCAITKSFHTSERRLIAPIWWLLLKPLARIATIFSSRSLRRWWLKLPAEEKQHYLRYSYLSRYKALAAGGVLVVAGGVYYSNHITETPFTHRRRFIALTDEQIMKVSKAEASMLTTALEHKFISLQDPSYRRVDRVVKRLLEANAELKLLPNSSWIIRIVDTQEQNAFVLPTGHIFVFSGLLSFAENDDQLSVVLGHELSHVLLSHAAEKVSYTQLLDWLIIVSLAAIWFFMPTDGIAVITHWFFQRIIQLSLHMPYSRKLENEADEVGLQLCAKACYDVRESSCLWNKMAILSKEKSENVPEMLSTHPLSEKRATHLDSIIPKALRIREDCKCPQLPQRDPRLKIEMYKKSLSRNPNIKLKKI